MQAVLVPAASPFPPGWVWPKVWAVHLSFQSSSHQCGLSEQQETDPRQGSIKFSVVVVVVWVFSFAIVVVNAVTVKALSRSPRSASRPLFLT